MRNLTLSSRAMPSYPHIAPHVPIKALKLLALSRWIAFSLAFIFFLPACKKDASSPGNPENAQTRQLLTNARAFLKDNTVPSDFNSLDFKHADLVPYEEARFWFVRVPFQGGNIASDFVLIQTDSSGGCVGGRIVHLSQDSPDGFQYNGTISVTTLKRAPVLSSPIKDGYIAAYHGDHSGQVTVNSGSSSPTSLPSTSSDPASPNFSSSPSAPSLTPDVVPATAGGSVLPEVLVVGYLNGAGSTSLQNYMRLMTLMAAPPITGDGSGASDTGGGAGGTAGSLPVTGSPVTPNTSGNTTNLFAPSSPNGGPGVTVTPPIDIEPEYIYNQSAIDLSSFMRCFDNIPSAGASYSVSLCSDLPVNSNPNYVTLGTESGHAFLTVTKQNGGQSITQSFGFYPVSAPSVLNPFGTIGGCIKDNGAHEINASLSMTISEAQFNTLRNAALQQSANNYSLAGINCATYALAVFNSIRSSPIAVSPITIYLPANTSIYNPSPTSQTVVIPYSPEAIFTKLQQLKTSGGSEAGNIQIDQGHSTASKPSHGPC